MPTSSAPARPPAVGSWCFRVIPIGWEFIPEFGLRYAVSNGQPGGVHVTEEALPDGMSLHQYVESQLVVMRHFLPDPAIDGPTLSRFGGAEAQEVALQYVCDTGQRVVQIQIYASSENLVGVATFTTTQHELAHVRDGFDMIRKNLVFQPPRGTK